MEEHHSEEVREDYRYVAQKMSLMFEFDTK